MTDVHNVCSALSSFCKGRNSKISAAIASALLASSFTCQALASPVINTTFPGRPAQAATLSSAEGIFLKYTLVEAGKSDGGGTILATLAVFDEIKHVVVYYDVSTDMRVDGAPLRCDNEGTPADEPFEETINRLHLCKSLPSHLVAGKTRLLLTYWPYRDWLGFPQLGVDEIQTLPIDCNLPTIPSEPEATNNSN